MIICLQIIVPKTFIIEQIIKKKKAPITPWIHHKTYKDKQKQKNIIII